MSEPLHVAFVWHMHQPYYRSALTGAFEMPWVRMHALKDYADMVQTLALYPRLHQTFNLVPSLVEQLQTYASGEFDDIYWEHTLKPAAELNESERAFVVERMCERSSHLRASSHPRYLELARKREGCAPRGWRECARAFTIAELRDLQIWFNLAWFDPQDLDREPLAELVARGRNFREDDKATVAQVQAEILAGTLPAYREALARGQVELSTSPYYHPILPLLANTDSARVSSPDALLPHTRFAHPEDARRQIESALDKHLSVFGERPQGMWCSEQAVGEDVISLLMDAGLRWTISDEAVLARSLAGSASLDGATPEGGMGTVEIDPPGRMGSPYAPYLLSREGRELAIVFRDHTLSDLIGFGYQSWAAKDAALDFICRLREIHAGSEHGASFAPSLVTVALDGENAWEYYPRDGRDFLAYLYQGLSADPSLRCVTLSEYLSASPPTEELPWLHTGSWIGGDLRTWSGDPAHNKAWYLLHEARDLAAREVNRSEFETAWHHVLVAEGSDWFWWFGDHHHTELDYVWDLNFRLHLQAVYRSLGKEVPPELSFPILDLGPIGKPTRPTGPINPVIDGVIQPGEWEAAGYLRPDLPSTMQPASATRVDRVQFGWHESSLCVVVVPRAAAELSGLEVEVRLVTPEPADHSLAAIAVTTAGQVELREIDKAAFLQTPIAASAEVLEILLPLVGAPSPALDATELRVLIGRRGVIEHVFRSVGAISGE